MKQALKRIGAAALASVTLALTLAGSALADLTNLDGFVTYTPLAGAFGSISTSGVTTTAAGAEKTDTVYGEITNVKRNVNFRSSASTKAAKVKGCTTLKKGASVIVLGKEGNWYKLQYGDYVGYVDQKYVKITTASTDTSANTNTNTTTNTTTNGGTTTGINTFNPFAPKENSGTSTNTNTSTNTFDPFAAYRNNNTSTNNNTTTNTTTDTSTSALGTGVIANVNSFVNFRSSASTKAAKVSGCSQLKKGTEVTVLAKEGSWYKLQYGSYVGYVDQKYVKLTSASTNTSTNNTNTNTTTNTTNNTTNNTGVIGGSTNTSVSSKAVLSSTDKAKIANIDSNYASAYRTNSDTVGYIYVPGTNVDYPILFDSNFFYNDHDINRKKETRGCIYSYTSAMTSCGITTISGHNSRVSGTMFHELHTWQNALKKNKNGNRIAYIKFAGTNYTQWEVFAMYETKNNAAAKVTMRTNILQHTVNKNTGIYGTAKQAWIESQIAQSEVNFGTSASSNDTIIVLMTCGDNYASTSYARLYFFLKGVA